MRRFLKWTMIGPVASVFILGSYLLAIQLTGNFHEVVPGELYRSNQPTAGQIANYKRRYGINTILNLRGSSEDASWYREEVAAATSLGVKHIDFRMLAERQLTLDETHHLIALLRDAPKPLLIHCKSGSDRTGLAAAIYLQQIAKVNEETAEQQLSLRFGHFAIPYLSPAYAMDENWENLEKTFGLSG
ncbi:dual specificity protein phosphatase family protein [Rhizobium sp. LjRoot98]|uniref:dual specificity protein phosphatase family protein n=1 Tax=Rhizobium sp. LjRoot98 TaxID=3342345 RepID=UPI003ECEC3CD